MAVCFPWKFWSAFLCFLEFNKYIVCQEKAYWLQNAVLPAYYPNTYHVPDTYAMEANKCSLQIQNQYNFEISQPGASQNLTQCRCVGIVSGEMNIWIVKSVFFSRLEGTGAFLVEKNISYRVVCLENRRPNESMIMTTTLCRWLQLLTYLLTYLLWSSNVYFFLDYTRTLPHPQTSTTFNLPIDLIIPLRLPFFTLLTIFSALPTAVNQLFLFL